MPAINEIKKEFNRLANKSQAVILQRFFKTAKGQYGYGDIFLGIKVPAQRQLAKKFFDLKLSEIQQLLNSQIHEHRLTALFILIGQYKKSDQKNKQKIFNLYLKDTKKINNWDLVDLSAPNIVGDFLLDKPRNILYQLAKSKNLWEKRIAILSTFAFIRNHEFEDTFKISEILLQDEHDLIHKAVGWMLREVGNRDQNIEEQFLRKYYKEMPRTMLRYAIEKFVENKRKKYLLGQY
ncbi:MAG: DNA alkylation repair protein [Candidatus Buchananbacteria bacterium]|nr:DNA alkylation repair protein [Candidatus Buchananbacteria bacterium]